MDKLKFCLIPRMTAGVNARTMCSKKVWDAARFNCYQRAGYTCEVCDGIGTTHPVECHEYWEWDAPNRIQRLTKLIALCPKCHEVVHIGHSMARAGHLFGSIFEVGEQYVNALQYMAKINQWTLDAVRKNLRWHREQLSVYNDILWTVNVDLVKDFKPSMPSIILEGFEL